MERILEIEAEVRHDVIAFLTNVNEHVGDAGRHIHGHDQQRRAGHGRGPAAETLRALLRTELDALADALRTAWAHKGTEMIGRSHAIHGELITFGSVRPAGGNRAQPHPPGTAGTGCGRGQVSGAMGTYANTDPRWKRSPAKSRPPTPPAPR